MPAPFSALKERARYSASVGADGETLGSSRPLGPLQTRASRPHLFKSRVCEFQNRTTQNSGAQAGASPGGRASTSVRCVCGTCVLLYELRRCLAHPFARIRSVLSYFCATRAFACEGAPPRPSPRLPPSSEPSWPRSARAPSEWPSASYTAPDSADDPWWWRRAALR